MQEQIESLINHFEDEEFPSKENLDSLFLNPEMNEYVKNTSDPEYFIKLVETINEVMLEGGWECIVTLPGAYTLSYGCVKIMCERFPEETKEPMRDLVRNALRNVSNNEDDIKAEMISEYAQIIQGWKDQVSDDDIVKATTGGILGYVESVGFWLQKNDTEYVERNLKETNLLLNMVENMSESAYRKLTEEISKYVPEQMEYVIKSREE